MWKTKPAHIYLCVCVCVKKREPANGGKHQINYLQGLPWKNKMKMDNMTDQL